MQKRFAQQISQQQLAVAGIVAALFFVALFAFVLIPALAPDTSAVTLTCLEDEEGDCLRLPQVTGINLDGAEFAFPDDFSHALYAGGHALRPRATRSGSGMGAVCSVNWQTMKSTSPISISPLCPTSRQQCAFWCRRV
jgi:hypothetical protein